MKIKYNDWQSKTEKIILIQIQFKWMLRVIMVKPTCSCVILFAFLLSREMLKTNIQLSKLVFWSNRLDKAKIVGYAFIHHYQWICDLFILNTMYLALQIFNNYTYARLSYLKLCGNVCTMFKTDKLFFIHFCDILIYLYKGNIKSTFLIKNINFLITICYFSLVLVALHLIKYLFIWCY